MCAKMKAFSLDEIAECRQVISDRYELYGINIPPASDMGRFLAAAASFIQAKSKSAAAPEKDISINRELLDKVVLCIRMGDVLRNIGADHPLYCHLRKLLKDRADPRVAGESRAKDALFELETMERLSAAGIETILEEPDITFTFCNEKMAIACKFIHSPASLKNRFKEARDQIIRSRRWGIIALEISDLIDHNILQVCKDEPEFRMRINNQVSSFINGHLPDFGRWAGPIQNPDYIIAVLAMCSTIIDLPHKSRLYYAQMIQGTNLHPPRRSTTELAQRLFAAIKTAPI